MADEKKDNGEPAEPQSAVPEVEAEIVDDVESDKASAGVGADETPPSPDETSETPAGKAGRRTFTPGVILFLAFAAIVLIAFAVWRLQGGNAPADEVESATPAASDDAAPAEPPAAARQEPDRSAPAETPPDDSGTPASKVANDVAVDAKQAESGIDPVVDIPSTDDTFLPPLPGESASAGNQALQDAAKEAARRFGPEADEAPQEETAPDAVESFEFDSEDAETSGVDKINAPASVSDTSAPDAVAADKIDNAELAELKESFHAETARLADALERERVRTSALEEEISSMRRDFEAALAARNERTGAEIDDLRAQIEKIRNGDDLTAAKRAAGAAAFDALATAVGTGRPFASELDRLARVAPDASSLDSLRRHADGGVLKPDALKESFPAAAREGLAAARRENAGAGFFARLGARAQSLVSVRPAEPQTGAAPRAVMSRAEAAVETGDLAAALEEIDSLPPGAREAMADWVEEARARVEVDRALQALRAQFLTPGEG